MYDVCNCSTVCDRHNIEDLQSMLSSEVIGACGHVRQLTHHCLLFVSTFLAVVLVPLSSQAFLM